MLGIKNIVVATDFSEPSAVAYGRDLAGSHGALKHFLMGSVPERVVRTAPRPVLTVRALEGDFIEGRHVRIIGRRAAA